LPPHAPDPRLDNRTGAVTQLSVSSAGHYDGKAQLNLPLTLQADAGGETAYRISLGMSVSGSAYTPFVLPGVFTTPILSQVSGSLSTGYGNAETSTTPLLVTVPASGISPATEMVFSQYVAPGDAVTAISGVFAARGGYVKGVTAPSVTATIEYVEIEAMSIADFNSVSAVPDLDTGKSMGLGLLATSLMCWFRRPRRDTTALPGDL
jgi:hypothetical protein